jgi:hypothetical protein
MPFVNISNHSSDRWSVEQREAALEFGSEIIDISFPNIPPNASEGDVHKLAKEFVDKVADFGIKLTIMCMGELSFVISFMSVAAGFNWDFVVATTERISIEEDGVKKSVFKFVQFREV